MRRISIRLGRKRITEIRQIKAKTNKWTMRSSMSTGTERRAVLAAIINRLKKASSDRIIKRRNH